MISTSICWSVADREHVGRYIKLIDEGDEILAGGDQKSR
jgi:hypothetical protein